VCAEACNRGATALDPRLDCEILQLEACRIAKSHAVAAAIQHERLASEARSKNCVANQRAVIISLNIIRITVPWPPAHHIRWRRGADWLALAGATGVNDGRDFGLRQRAIEDCPLVHAAVEVTLRYSTPPREPDVDWSRVVRRGA